MTTDEICTYCGATQQLADQAEQIRSYEMTVDAADVLRRQLAEAQALLQRTHRDLDACQRVIWLAGVGARGYGFDPAYCEDAQARLAEINTFLSATAQPADGVNSDE